MTKRKPRGLSEELRILESKNPKVRKAAQSYEEVKQSIIQGRSHPMPCNNLSCKWHH